LASASICATAQTDDEFLTHMAPGSCITDVGLLIGTGYSHDIAGGAVMRAVDAFCLRHGYEVVAVTADSSATFAVRIDRGLLFR
jgi:hypothetical protein